MTTEPEREKIPLYMIGKTTAPSIAQILRCKVQNKKLSKHSSISSLVICRISDTWRFLKTNKFNVLFRNYIEDMSLRCIFNKFEFN